MSVVGCLWMFNSHSVFFLLSYTNLRRWSVFEDVLAGVVGSGSTRILEHNEVSARSSSSSSADTGTVGDVVDVFGLTGVGVDDVCGGSAGVGDVVDVCGSTGVGVVGVCGGSAGVAVGVMVVCGSVGVAVDVRVVVVICGSVDVVVVVVNDFFVLFSVVVPGLSRCLFFDGTAIGVSVFMWVAGGWV